MVFENWVYVIDPVDEDTVNKFSIVIILLNGIVLIFGIVKIHKKNPTFLCCLYNSGQ